MRRNLPHPHVSEDELEEMEAEDPDKPILDIIENWRLIEADFQREYGINLIEALPRLSWRRFSVLLNGVSEHSVYVLKKRNEKEGNVVVEDAEQGERVVEHFFK
jgi:hypothetical protein